ncbi:hypothetical protein DP120_03050 [Planococcus halotolerans]|uniref:YesK-like protein n=2 Tax=Planococcus halotolerans TaxID=2233542 RepID=A0A365L7B0_9BACL|nr:hypothetical protein DP120_03050 [Planococcus halotolerans]
MDMLIFISYIILLCYGVSKFAGNKRHRWINAGYVTTFLLPVIVLFLTIRIVGALTGDGIAGGVAGFGYAIVTCVIGFIFLFIGYTSKNVRSD